MNGKRVSIYGPNERRKLSGTLEYGKAKELVLQGLARWVDRCRSIRLTRLDTKLRGASCNIRPYLMNKYIDGDKRAIEAVEAWNHRFENSIDDGTGRVCAVDPKLKQATC